MMIAVEAYPLWFVVASAGLMLVIGFFIGDCYGWHRGWHDGARNGDRWKDIEGRAEKLALIDKRSRW